MGSMKKTGGKKMSKKSRGQFLKRPLRFMVRFNQAEIREAKNRAKRTGLSMSEFCRRKILDQPAADLSPKEVEYGATV